MSFSSHISGGLLTLALGLCASSGPVAAADESDTSSTDGGQFARKLAAVQVVDSNGKVLGRLVPALPTPGTSATVAAIVGGDIYVADSLSYKAQIYIESTLLYGFSCQKFHWVGAALFKSSSPPVSLKELTSPFRLR